MSNRMLLELMRYRATYILLVGIGFLLFGYFLYEENELKRVRSGYASAPCVVQTSEVEEVVSRGRRGQVTGVNYYPRISYTYSVKGTKYTGTEYRHGECGMDLDEAVSVVSRFQPGAKTNCYYDSDQPGNAVLNKVSDQRNLERIAIFGVISLVLGVGGWVVMEFVFPAQPAAQQPARSSATTGTTAPGKLEIPAWSALAKMNLNGNDATSPTAQTNK
jgi:Protein of unknown function (DUF3592)